jgi:hypothetical protein
MVSDYQSDITLVVNGIRISGRIFSGPDFNEIADACIKEIAYLESIKFPDRTLKVETKN